MSIGNVFKYIIMTLGAIWIIVAVLMMYLITIGIAIMCYNEGDYLMMAILIVVLIFLAHKSTILFEDIGKAR